MKRTSILADRVPGWPALFGMVHVQALPGTPFAGFPMHEISRIACAEALAYQEHGFFGIVLENMHDRPYLKGTVGAEITAGMTRVAVDIRRAVGPSFPIGVQILAGANQEALAVALAADLNFIRAEGCVFGHVADEGWIEACAGQLLRERKRLGADHIEIWTDIMKKHSSHSITADLEIGDWAHAAEFFGLDGVIVTGRATGLEADQDVLNHAKKATSLPVIVGSGITVENFEKYHLADAVIVGSSVKQGGIWSNPLDHSVIRRLAGQSG